MLAAYHGHADLVKFLIQHGADPNRLNDRLQSPLAGAVFKKEDDVIEVRNLRALVLYAMSFRLSGLKFAIHDMLLKMPGFCLIAH